MLSLPRVLADYGEHTLSQQLVALSPERKSQAQSARSRETRPSTSWVCCDQRRTTTTCLPCYKSKGSSLNLSSVSARCCKSSKLTMGDSLLVQSGALQHWSSLSSAVSFSNFRSPSNSFCQKLYLLKLLIWILLYYNFILNGICNFVPHPSILPSIRGSSKLQQIETN